MGEHKERYSEFRNLLRRGMSGFAGTQADFARNVGIAYTTLNRYLNNEFISRPSEATLRKLASCMSSGVTYDMLLESCGYAKTQSKTDTQIIDEFKDFLNNGIKTFFLQSMHSSVNDFIETAIMIYARGDISYSIGEKQDIAKADKPKGTSAVVVDFSISISDKKSASAAVLVYCIETNYSDNSPACFVTGVETSAQKIAEYGGETAIKYLKLCNPEDRSDLPLIIHTKKTNRNLEPLSPEERLLRAIFGEEDDNKSYKNVSGIGFYLDENLPEYVFERFLKNHKDSFCQSEQEIRAYKKYFEEGEGEKSFFNLKSNTPTGAGSYSRLAAIINIIAAEYDIHMQGFKNLPSEEIEGNRTCILFSPAYPWELNETEKNLSNQKLFEILDGYAKELRSEVSYCSFTATIYKRN